MQWNEAVSYLRAKLDRLAQSGRAPEEKIAAMRTAIDSLKEDTDFATYQAVSKNLKQAFSVMRDEMAGALDEMIQAEESFSEEDIEEEPVEEDESDDSQQGTSEGDEDMKPNEGDTQVQSVEQGALSLQTEVERARRLNDLAEKTQAQGLATQMVQSLPPGPAQSAARKHFADVSTLADLDARSKTLEVIVQEFLGPKKSWGAGVGFIGLAQDAPIGPEGRPPENRMEMIDYLVQQAKDEYEIDKLFVGVDAGGQVLRQDSHGVRRDARATVNHPSDVLRQTLTNIVNVNPHLGDAYTLHLQGQGHYMYQALPDGGMGSGSFAAAQPFVFPMVSMVFPQLFITRIGATYPIDRPLAKIFTRKVIGRHQDGGAENELHDFNYHDPTLADSPGEGSQSSRVRISVTGTDISAADRTLSAIWDIPTEQDYRAYHNRDIMGEVVAEAANEIAREINTVCLNLVYAASADREIEWGKQLPDDSTYPGWTMRDWNKSLLGALQRANTEIFKSRYRMGSILLCDPDTVTRLSQTMEMGVFQTARDQWDLSYGISLAGSVSNLYTVFNVAQWAYDHPNTAVVVARGETFSEAGLIYAPYTYEVMPPLTQPGTRTREIGILSRDAITVLIEQMFARVTIVDEAGIPW